MLKFRPLFASAGLLLLAASSSLAAVNVAAWYRLGEADPGALAGAAGAAATTDSAGGVALSRIGAQTSYTAETANAESALAIDFASSGGYARNAPVITTATGWGVEAWVQSDNAATTSVLAYSGNSGSSGMGLYQIGGNYVGLVGGVSIIGSAPADGQWTHLAMVADGGSTVFYVNGTASAFGPGMNAASNAGSNFVIGTRPDFSEQFDGRIDEVRVFTFAAGQFSSADLLVGAPPSADHLVPTAPRSRGPKRRADSVVVFAELMYHPAAANEAEADQREWIELHNQHAVNVDISGWSLGGGVSFLFPNGTVVAAGARVVVAASPPALEAATGFAGALGPWSGKLDNGGETIELRNLSGRVMDTIDYSDGGDWPAAPDGAGPSLAKRAANLASDDPRSWSASRAVGGTPGAVNFPAAPAPVALVLNELTTTFAEVANTGADAIDLTGSTLLRVGATSRSSTALPETTLAPGAMLSIPLESAAGDRVAIALADGTTVLEARVVKATPRARHADGRWLTPTAPTPGAVNVFALNTAVVINEIMFDPPKVAGTSGQFIELRNTSASAVNLAGWRLSQVDFTFAAGAQIPAGGYLVVAANPGAPGLAGALGPWAGQLSRRGARLVLEDANGNPADEVRFAAGGRWPLEADGGGSSMELRDSRADNSAAEAWAASDRANVPWQTFTWRGPAVPSIAGEPDLWHELALCLLDGNGEALIDDVSVKDTVSGAELLQNGGFADGAAHWRFLGTHRHSFVENGELHLIATGSGEYQGNQIETTFAGNQSLVTGRVYEISLRARWLNGGSKLNTRLYFNRIPKTNTLAVAPTGGTPGAANSRAVANIGPTFTKLAHTPTVPAANEPVTVSVEAADPDGVSSAVVRYSVQGAPWQSVPMTSTDGRRFSASLPGQPASRLVQFYVEAQDGAGVGATFPAAGPQSRALYAVQDGQAGSARNFRLVMPLADAAFLHQPANVLSNESIRATVIADEREVFYNVGVRLKGSFVGRNTQRVGFNLQFHGDQLFRGVHDRLSIDRSRASDVGQVEIVAKHIANRAGGVFTSEDDLGRFIHPLPTYTSSCQLRLSAFNDNYLAAQFPDGEEGSMFEVESLRWHTSSSDGQPESPKVPATGGANSNYANPDLQNLGDSAEPYRWNHLLVSERGADDFSGAIAVGKLFSLNGAAFSAQAPQVLDVDQWLRALACQTLVGPLDNVFTGTIVHNFRHYQRPSDRRSVYLPWDWDFAFTRDVNAPLIGGGNISKIVTANADHRRRFLGHVHDIVARVFNASAMGAWTQHYGAVAGENYAPVLDYIGQRAGFATSQLPNSTAFTASAGSVNVNGAVTITGRAPISVWFIEVDGVRYEPTWTNDTSWSLVVALAPGANTLAIRGTTLGGAPVSGASATVMADNPSNGGRPALRINEWLAANSIYLDPADGDADDWIELFNPTTGIVDLSGWKVTDNPAAPAQAYVIPSGFSIPAGGRLLIWADNEPAQNAAPGSLHANFKISAGETLALLAPDGREIDRATISNLASDEAEGRFPDGADLLSPLTLPTPGEPNALTTFSEITRTSGLVRLTFTTTPGLRYELETSADLIDWSSSGLEQTASGSSLTFQYDAGTDEQRTFRVRVRK